MSSFVVNGCLSLNEAEAFNEVVQVDMQADLLIIVNTGDKKMMAMASLPSNNTVNDTMYRVVSFLKAEINMCLNALKIQFRRGFLNLSTAAILGWRILH